MALLLTTDQIDAAAATLVTSDNKLTAGMVSDLVSIFRGYLGPLASSYTLKDTLAAQQDLQENDERIAAKLAACLALFQENQFTPESGFAPTAANRTGFNYSLDGEVYEIFKYAFGLLWDIPVELPTVATTGSGGRFQPSQGRFHRHHR
jgi:hypothetical protein